MKDVFRKQKLESREIPSSSGKLKEKNKRVKKLQSAATVQVKDGDAGSQIAGAGKHGVRNGLVDGGRSGKKTESTHNVKEEITVVPSETEKATQQKSKKRKYCHVVGQSPRPESDPINPEQEPLKKKKKGKKKSKGTEEREEEKEEEVIVMEEASVKAEEGAKSTKKEKKRGKKGEIKDSGGARVDTCIHPCEPTNQPVEIETIVTKKIIDTEDAVPSTPGAARAIMGSTPKTEIKSKSSPVLISDDGLKKKKKKEKKKKQKPTPPLESIVTHPESNASSPPGADKGLSAALNGDSLKTTSQPKSKTEVVDIDSDSTPEMEKKDVEADLATNGTPEPVQPIHTKSGLSEANLQQLSKRGSFQNSQKTEHGRPGRKSTGSQPGTPFKRVQEDYITYGNERLMDNSFHTKNDTYGVRAHQDLVVTKGKGFRKEKTKKKRLNHHGGKLNYEVNSYQFSDSD